VSKLTKNVNDVNKKKWRKWSPIARRAFNELYYVMNQNQSAFLHPKTKPVTAKQWSTTAWNAAWMAADNLEESLKNYAE
jgi:hypothetical protein